MDFVVGDFTKRRYIESLSQAEKELGSILPYGEWGDTFSEPFKRIRSDVAAHFGGERKYLVAPQDTCLPHKFADQFNETIVPLTRGEVENKDVILQYHGPPAVDKRNMRGRRGKPASGKEPSYPRL